MIRKFPTEQHCIEYLERVRWGESKPKCPYCGHECSSHKRKDGRYMCGHCNRPFRVTVGTLFHKTHQSLQQWFLLIVLMMHAKKGASTHQLARDCDLKQPTVWLMTMKIRKAMQAGNGGLLQGIVEIDETYIGGKPRKKNDGGTGGTSKRGRGTAKAPVLGVAERDGDVRARVSENVTRENIREFISDHVDESALIYSDAYRSYKGITHKQVDHKRHFVDPNGVHTNGIESFWATLKRGVFGQFHHISTTHLGAYLAEFTYRYNRRKIDETFDELVQWMVAVPNNA